MLNKFSSRALYTAAQLREIDRLAIAAGTPGVVLMRRAAEAAWQAAERYLQDSLAVACKDIVVLCGAGNNGGDAFLVARAAKASGAAVKVFAFADSRGDAATARAALQGDGVTVQSHAQLDAATLATADLVVDGLLGTGAAGPPRDSYAAAIALVNAACRPVLALDIPSGICADSGRLLGAAAICADLTVAFIGFKRGLFTDAATEHVGTLVLATLGVDCAAYPVTSSAALCDFDALEQRLPARKANHYKNRSGHVLVIGGDYGMAGAVILAGRAAMLCGAGLVSVATRTEHVAAVVAAQPELMVHGIHSAAALAPLLARATVLVIGPGLGQSAWSQQLLLKAAASGIPAVVDADALNLVAANCKLLPCGDALLTPHPGEARRLAAGFAIDPGTDRFELAGALQRSSAKNLLLKGAGTIIANSDQMRLCPYGHPVLATAGSGDVLSGVAAALLAQGMSMHEAAQLAACLHAHAGEQWAARHGARGMLAGDLIAVIRELLNDASPHGSPQ
ncbi:MAG: NAD(P)H-hydrate dehydratase [Pseudomonadales bacterium]